MGTVKSADIAMKSWVVRVRIRASMSTVIQLVNRIGGTDVLGDAK